MRKGSLLKTSLDASGFITELFWPKITESPQNYLKTRGRAGFKFYLIKKPALFLFWQIFFPPKVHSSMLDSFSGYFPHGCDVPAIRELGVFSSLASGSQ